MTPKGKAGVARGIRRCIDVAAGDERLYLRGDAENLAVIRKVERFDTIRIASQKQGLLPAVPERKCVHAAQAVEHGHLSVRI